LSDEEERLRGLLARGLDGDEAAYRGFLDGLVVRLRAFLRRRLTRAPDEVEDLLQEILLAVHNQRHSYDPAQPLTAWLHAIARYKLVDCLRRRGRRSNHPPRSQCDRRRPHGDAVARASRLQDLCAFGRFLGPGRRRAVRGDLAKRPQNRPPVQFRPRIRRAQLNQIPSV